MDYQIVTANFPDQLQLRVEEAMSQGWILQGGVSVTCLDVPAGAKDLLYAQALIRD